MFATLPSTDGLTVTLRFERDFYYYITPWGNTRTFRTKRAAMSYARSHKWLVSDQAK